MSLASRLQNKKVLITGANGSIGAALANELENNDVTTIRTDIDTLDVTNPADCTQILEAQPDVVFHLAGAKHAPKGEASPEAAMQINALGTINVVEAANTVNARVVTASTCKACNPETAYGATKLIAERITLNKGGSVARYYNVVETQGNVFDIWANQTPPGDPIPYTDCYRYFITLKQALQLTLWAAILKPARYTYSPGLPRHMSEVAAEHYPNRDLQEIPLRRGDRKTEPLHASSETITPTSVRYIYQVESRHDLCQFT